MIDVLDLGFGGYPFYLFINWRVYIWPRDLVDPLYTNRYVLHFRP